MNITAERAPWQPPTGDLRLAADTAPHAVPTLANPVEVDLTGTVVDRVEAHAEQAPDLHAIISGEESISYRDLSRRVAGTVALLRDAGCARGDVVACLGRRGAFTPILFLALERIGAVYLPVDPEWPEARISDVLKISGSALLVDYTDPRDVQITPMDGFGVRVPDPAFLDADPRYIIYTSGTTGRPKGAIVAQVGMLNHMWAKIADLGLTSADRVAFTAPLVFDISVWQMVVPLAIGATVVVVPDEKTVFPRRLYRELVRTEVSVVELVPTALRLLLDEAERQGGNHPMPSLRWLISTGEELKPSLADQVLTTLPDVRLLNAYGPTECSDDVTHHVVTPADTGRTRLPVGTPIGNAKLYCLVHVPADGTWRAPEPGEIGELFVGGVVVGLGYLADESANLAAFFHDVLDPDSPTGRLYRTGDLGRIDAQGVHYLGRVDRQVKVAGVRMELDEIESVLSGHPAVRHCAVTLDGDEHPHLTAHFVPKQAVDVSELADFVRARLPAGLVPTSWRRLDELPLTPNGKVDRRGILASSPPATTAPFEEDRHGALGRPVREAAPQRPEVPSPRQDA